MRARGKPYDEDTWMRVPEARDGFAPVDPIPVGTPLFNGNGLAPCDQPGALAARNNLPVEILQLHAFILL